MASVNLSEENIIKVNLSEDSSITTNLSNEATLNAQVQDINYIPGYVASEEERRANEIQRVENENEREAYYEEIQKKVANGEFKGEKGDKGEKGEDGLTIDISVNGSTYTHDNGLITLPDYPIVPTNVSQLNNDSNFISDSNYVHTDNNYTSEEKEKVAVIDKSGNGTKYLSDDGTYKTVSGEGGTSDYNDLKNKPSINNIELVGNKTLNELGFEVPTKTSDLENNSGFITNADIPSNISSFNNDSGYITSIPDEYVTETELTSKGYSTFSGSYNDLTNKPTIPTKTSDLTNDSEYISSIPSEYITEAELSSKGYLTSIPDTYKTKTENDALYQPKGTYLTEEQDPTVPSYVKTITEQNITDWNNKSDFGGSYNDLTDTPTIPTKISELTNDSGFIDALEWGSITGTLSNQTDLKNELDNKLTYVSDLGDYSNEEIIDLLYLSEGFYRVKAKINLTFSGYLRNGNYEAINNTYKVDAGSLIIVTNKAKGTNTYKTAFVTGRILSSNYVKDVDLLVNAVTFEWNSDGFGQAYESLDSLTNETGSSGGGTTDVQLNGVSIVNGGIANIITNSAYDSASNKLATMSDIPKNSDFYLSQLKQKDYYSLDSKPCINNIELDSGNNTLEKLGIQASGNYALKSEIPTNTSELTNDSGYLTEHQDISGKVDKIDGKGLSTNDYTTEEKTKLAGIEVGAEVNTVTSVNSQTGDVNIAIPSKISDLTNDSGFLTSYTETDPVYTADKPNIALKSELFSKDYNDLTNVPSIPTKVSELENDSNFINSYTETDPLYMADKPDIAFKNEIPANTSDLYNDSNYVSDANYVHTDNNYTTEDMTKLKNIPNYIIESGSNANGYYEKYASGTLKQWGKVTVTAELKTAHGSTGWYRTASEQFINHPIPFVGEKPVVNLMAQAALNFAYISTNNLDKSGFYPLTSYSAAGATRYVHWNAIGKWK